MKRPFIAVLTALVGAFVTCAPVAHADPNDMRIGVFTGRWCGYSADYHVDSKEGGDSWIFHGRLTFDQYPGLEDELWIEQYDDNSLRMIRYLGGEQEGLTQVVQTLPPAPPTSGDRTGAVYQRDFSIGDDCEGGREKNSYVFVRALAEPPSTELPRLTDATDMYSEPGKTSPPVGVVPKDTTVRVLERRNVLGTDWTHISFFIWTNELTGWVESQFVP